MVPLLSLWLPILISAVLVFAASSVIHMFLKYHNNDFAKLPDEEAFRDAVRPLNLPPGQYVVPHEMDQAARQTDEFKAKCESGPVAFVGVLPSQIPTMGRSLIEWFVYTVVVGVFAAYIAGRTLAPGADYLSVFQIVGATAFAGYALALAQGSIWMSRPWGVTLKSMFDGLLYGLLTAGTFGWLWP